MASINRKNYFNLTNFNKAFTVYKTLRYVILVSKKRGKKPYPYPQNKNILNLTRKPELMIIHSINIDQALTIYMALFQLWGIRSECKRQKSLPPWNIPVEKQSKQRFRSGCESWLSHLPGEGLTSGSLCGSAFSLLHWDDNSTCLCVPTECGDPVVRAANVSIMKWLLVNQISMLSAPQFHTNNYPLNSTLPGNSPQPDQGGWAQEFCLLAYRLCKRLCWMLGSPEAELKCSLRGKMVLRGGKQPGAEQGVEHRPRKFSTNRQDSLKLE